MEMYPEHPIETLRRAGDAEIDAELLVPLGKRILDIGCGEGDLTRTLARAGAEVAGIDPHEGRIERARAKAAEVFYRLARRFENAEDYEEHSASRHERRREEIAAKSAKIRKKFLENAEPGDGGFALDLIYRVNVFRKGG